MVRLEGPQCRRDAVRRLEDASQLAQQVGPDLASLEQRPLAGAVAAGEVLGIDVAVGVYRAALQQPIPVGQDICHVFPGRIGWALPSLVPRSFASTTAAVGGVRCPGTLGTARPRVWRRFGLAAGFDILLVCAATWLRVVHGPFRRCGELSPYESRPVKRPAMIVVSW